MNFWTGTVHVALG